MKLKHLFEESFGECTPGTIDSHYSVGGVKVDNVRGVGATPYNQNCSYFGFAAWLTPSKFLELAKPDPERGAKRAQQFEELVRKNPIGNPFLIVQYNVEKQLFVVKGHEGRGRMAGIEQINGDKPFPVHFIGISELRARNLTTEILVGLCSGVTVTSERGEQISLETKKIFWMGQEITG